MFDPQKESFLYFAYGSNLLKKRIRINNPTAEFLGVGRLSDHQLDFVKYSNNWRGASATIIPSEGHYIWGAIWQIQNKDMPALDKQEGVHTNWYFPKIVEVTTENNERVQCRTYQQTINPPLRKDNEVIPLERRPSSTYLDCIIKGAIECKLPLQYIDVLKKIPHNGNEASPEMLEKLKILVLFGTKRKLLNTGWDSDRDYMYLCCVHDTYYVYPRLDFIKYSKFWGGPSSTLVPTANAHVWGVIWRLHYEDITALDNMNEVDVKKYFIKYIDALTPHTGELRCRTYVQKYNPLPRGDNDAVPIERWPSRTYMQVMLQGALEHGLPDYYIKQIRKLKDNGDEGCIRIHCLLKRYAQAPSCKCIVPGRIPRKPLKLNLKTLREEMKDNRELK